jgi:hypothetical protein
MTLQLTFKSDLKLEFAFGKITQGKEMQLYGEYFPAISPLITDYVSQQVGTFSVISSNSQGITPKMGALTQWPSLKNYQDFYKDPRFTQVKPLLDDSLDLLSDGHFFKSQDKVIEINTETDYAIVLSKDDVFDLTTLLTLPLESESPQQTYAGKSLTIALWNENTDKLLQTSAINAEVFRIRFNKPTQ